MRNRKLQDMVLGNAMAELMVSDREPRLRWDRPTPVIARDRARGYVLLTGLGVMGVGTMWFPDDGHYDGHKDYEEAPEESSLGSFGGPKS